MRKSSATVHSIVPLRARSSSEEPRAQGCSLVKYLSAAPTTLQIASKARVKAEAVVFPLEKADEALDGVRSGKLEGAAVLLVRS